MGLLLGIVRPNPLSSIDFSDAFVVLLFATDPTPYFTAVCAFGLLWCLHLLS